jgi:membrane protease YdiL (CAAX protease family)
MTDDASGSSSPVARGLRWVFLDDARRRLRTGYRLLLHGIGVLLSYFVGAGLVWAAGGTSAARAIAVALQTAFVVLVTWCAARWLDRRSPLDLIGRLDRAAALELLFGSVLGGGLIVTVAIAEGVSLGASYAPVAITTAAFFRALSALLFFVAVAIDEELWFRAYQLTNLAEGVEGWLGPRGARAAALVISALVFGLAHAMNPNASVLATANIAVGGLFLGVSYAITGRLYVALGLHFAWNTAQCFLDMPVSGQTLYDDLFVHREETGEDLVTGGAFGPEAGLLGLAAMIVGTVLCVIHARSRRTRDEKDLAKLDEIPSS